MPKMSQNHYPPTPYPLKNHRPWPQIRSTPPSHSLPLPVYVPSGGTRERSVSRPTEGLPNVPPTPYPSPSILPPSALDTPETITRLTIPHYFPTTLYQALNQIMANTASAEKRARQTTRREDRNRTIRSRVKNARRSALEAVTKKDKSAAKSAVATLASVADRAASKGVIHRNKANRLKSRLTLRAQA